MLVKGVSDLFDHLFLSNERNVAVHDARYGFAAYDVRYELLISI